MNNWKQPIPTGLDVIFGDDHPCQLLYRELIYRACNGDTVVTLDGRKYVELKRGQVIFGSNKWAKYLDWRPTTCLRRLNRLCDFYKKTTKQADKNYTIVSILNYDELTDMANQRPTSGVATTNQLPTSKSISNKTQVILDTSNKVLEPSTSKTGHVPCTRLELLEICRASGATIKDVNTTHDIIMDKIAEGSFKDKHNKPYKTVYYTLKNWVRMGLERGTIQPRGQFDALTFEDDAERFLAGNYYLGN